MKRGEAIILKTDEEIEKIAASGRLVNRVLSEMEAAVKPGVTTMELAAIADRLTEEAGARASFKGYHGFPASICASVNEQVIHGIPNRIPLQEGDIVGLDYGAFLNGFHGDSARTVPVGKIDPEVRRLLDVTKEALMIAVNMVKPGVALGDISHAVQKHCEKAGFSVVREMVGHGIGRDLHEPPEVPNYGRQNEGPRLRKGMTFCIEPMINAGQRYVATLPDQWTIVTTDKSFSAHFEHTVAVTANGVRVLTNG